MLIPCTFPRQGIDKKLISAPDKIKSPSKLWKFPLLRNTPASSCRLAWLSHDLDFMSERVSVKHHPSTVVKGSVRFSRCFWRSSARALMKWTKCEVLYLGRRLMTRGRLSRRHHSQSFIGRFFPIFSSVTTRVRRKNTRSDCDVTMAANLSSPVGLALFFVINSIASACLGALISPARATISSLISPLQLFAFHCSKRWFGW